MAYSALGFQSHFRTSKLSSPINLEGKLIGWISFWVKQSESCLTPALLRKLAVLVSSVSPVEGTSVCDIVELIGPQALCSEFMLTDPKDVPYQPSRAVYLWPFSKADAALTLSFTLIESQNIRLSMVWWYLVWWCGTFRLGTGEAICRVPRFPSSLSSDLT